MAELVTVSRVEQIENLKTYINDLFARERYDEIMQAIGMHSILVDPENMTTDQEHLYHLVLNLLKKRVSGLDSRSYSAWLIAFPSLLARIVSQEELVTDDAARAVLASRHAAFGPFSSLDEFFFWALDDRRLTLAQIVRYTARTMEIHRS
jgi:hypothetical protein